MQERTYCSSCDLDKVRLTTCRSAASGASYRFEPTHNTSPLDGCSGVLSGRAVQELCFNESKRFWMSMFRISERLPEAIPLDDIKSFEHKADRIEFPLTSETSKQHSRQTELRPSRAVGPIQHHRVRRQLWQDVRLDVLLPVWAVRIDEQDPSSTPTNPPEPDERVESHDLNESSEDHNDKHS